MLGYVLLQHVTPNLSTPHAANWRWVRQRLPAFGSLTKVARWDCELSQHDYRCQSVGGRSRHTLLYIKRSQPKQGALGSSELNKSVWRFSVCVYVFVWSAGSGGWRVHLICCTDRKTSLIEERMAHGGGTKNSQGHGFSLEGAVRLCVSTGDLESSDM